MDYRRIMAGEGRKPTSEELQATRDLRAQGLTHREIASRLGRHRATIGKRLKKWGSAPRTPNTFTNEEKELLLELFGQGLQPKEMAEYLPRHTPSSIASKLKGLGCRCRPPRWSDDEKEIMVRMLARGKSYKEIGARLGRTPRAVETQNSRRRKKMREDPKFQAAAKVLEFCLDPARVLRAVRDSQIVPYLLDAETTDEELAGLLVRAKGGW